MKGKKKKVSTEFNKWFKQFQKEIPVETYIDIRFLAEAAFLAGQIAAMAANIKRIREIKV